MIFFTSDIHFGHKNILRFTQRGKLVGSVEEMDGAIIANWNKMITPEDTVYILGDVAMCNMKYAEECLRSLNGELHLIVGNHDKGIVNSAARKQFKSMQDYKRITVPVQDLYSKEQGINYGADRTIVMFHYPIYEWDGIQYGNYHLHGHTHGNINGAVPGRVVDIGLDGPLAVGTLAPVSLDQVVEYMERQPVRTHGHYNGV
jgi:calcineurin-like phosphoesterase family protein